VRSPWGHALAQEAGDVVGQLLDGFAEEFEQDGDVAFIDAEVCGEVGGHDYDGSR
jgi:hypothetical protein